jgi:hypothetical protein
MRVSRKPLVQHGAIARRILPWIAPPEVAPTLTAQDVLASKAMMCALTMSFPRLLTAFVQATNQTEIFERHFFP